MRVPRGAAGRKGEVLDRFPKLKGHCARCEDRPAWQRTLEAYEQRLDVPRGSTR